MEMDNKNNLFFGYIVSFLDEKFLMIRIFDLILDVGKETHPYVF